MTTSTSAAFVAPAAARTSPNLAEVMTPDLVATHLCRPGAWAPWPRAEDRTSWTALPAKAQADLVKRAERAAEAPWPALPASLFAQYHRTGDREAYQQASYARRDQLLDLVLGECCEDRGRFSDTIVDGVWSICEESFWGVPATNRRRWLPGAPLPDVSDPVVDLFAAETGALLAWTCYLLHHQLQGDLVVVKARVAAEAGRRLLDPYEFRDDWFWLGATSTPVNNWNPWIHSNLLTTLLLLEDDQDRRCRLVSRIIAGLDAYLNCVPEDGGCDEGITYWWRAVGCFYECLEMLSSASGGRLSGFGHPAVAALGAYPALLHIGGRWYVNFADGSAQPGGFPHLLYSYGRRLGNETIVQQALSMRDQPAGIERTSVGRVLPELFDDAWWSATRSEPVLVRDGWLPQTEVCVAREHAGEAAGLFLAVKGGHNDESHNHNDVGSFVVALDGRPRIVDVGVGTYDAKTFGPDRYDSWTMRSFYHNVPRIGGCEQQAGARYRASDLRYSPSDEATELSANITGAYPAEAGVREWRRTARLQRTASPAAAVVLVDEWQLEEHGTPLELVVMTPNRVVPLGKNALLLTEDADQRPLRLDYDGPVARIEVQQVDLDDVKLARVWGPVVRRIAFCLSAASREGRCSITFRAT